MSTIHNNNLTLPLLINVKLDSLNIDDAHKYMVAK